MHHTTADHPHMTGRGEKASKKKKKKKKEKTTTNNNRLIIIESRTAKILHTMHPPKRPPLTKQLTSEVFF
jgi:hypothetical protein